MNEGQLLMHQTDDFGAGGGEVKKIGIRYQQRDLPSISARYVLTSTAVMMSRQERERALLHWIRKSELHPLVDKTLLEIGCGTGGNILEMLRFGFEPHNLLANELLESRARVARFRLPSATELIVGDALKMDLGQKTFDVVFQSTVFSSILDDNFQEQLAKRMWNWVKPGGQILWYDFIYDNPNNNDVRGVPISRVKQLFPLGNLHFRRVTLAPPIARRVSSIHPALYSMFNMFLFLRTHVLCWIQKPDC